MPVIRLNEERFVDEFRKVRPNQFSTEALEALFKYYSRLEDELGESINFNPIEICCEWCEVDELEGEEDFIETGVSYLVRQY